MKKLLITLLLITFCSNNAFAELSSFQEKLKRMDEIVQSSNYTPMQAQAFIKMTQDYVDCAPSNNGFTCVTMDQICLISQNKSTTSFRCFNETDLDKFLAS